jgi:hypothetical protein
MIKHHTPFKTFRQFEGSFWWVPSFFSSALCGTHDEDLLATVKIFVSVFWLHFILREIFKLKQEIVLVLKAFNAC